MNEERRVSFRQSLESDGVVFAPLALDPLAALLAEKAGFRASYLSGGALGFQYAVSEALLTLTEIVDVARRITARCDLPLIVDGGVGFGDPVHVQRAVWEFESAGAVALELEDQVAPKRVHHHVGVEHLVDTELMCEKISAATEARLDKNLLIIARTGANTHESLNSAIERLNRYIDSGADLVMAFGGNDDLKAISSSVPVPLSTIASMNRQTSDRWQDVGCSLVIDAFTSQAIMISGLKKSYERFRNGEDSGAKVDGEALHRELVELCELKPLLDLETRTTEKNSITKRTD
jgi:2-methylisocitrate lyase-like PEP mutase family enzyme